MKDRGVLSQQAQKPVEKHKDKFGYASLCVGDSAERFSNHVIEYGDYYGLAAQNVGRSWGQGGTADQTLLSAQEVFQTFSGGLPLVVLGTLVSSVATSAQAAAVVRQTREIRRLAHTQEKRLDVQSAEHLLHITRREELAALVATANLYGQEEKVDVVYLVVSDTFQSAQLKLYLQQQGVSTSDNSKDAGNHSISLVHSGTLTIEVFSTLQDAFLAVSKATNETKALIYFHSLRRVEIPHDIYIRNCHDFVLRSDAGQVGLEPRLVFTGKIHLIESSGQIRSVAICGGYQSDKNSRLSFVRCTSSKNAQNFSNNPQKDFTLFRNRHIFSGLAILLLAVPGIAMTRTMFLSSWSGTRIGSKT